MNRDQAIKFVNNLFTEVWTNLDVSKIPHFYHKDVEMQIGKKTAYYENIVHRLEFVKEHYQTVENEIQHVLVDGDKVIVRLRQHYRQANDVNGKTYAIVFIYQLQNDKVLKGWGCIDPNVNYFES